MFGPSYFLFRIQRLEGNSADPDEAAHYELPHQDLHSLQNKFSYFHFRYFVFTLHIPFVEVLWIQLLSLFVIYSAAFVLRIETGYSCLLKFINYILMVSLFSVLSLVTCD